MKTPEEIKKGLDCCFVTSNCDDGCPYDNNSCDYTFMNSSLFVDALAYIEQLEEQIDLMKIQMHGDCGVCKHRGGFDVEGAIMSQRCYECLKKETRPNWEYEGLPEVARKESK